MSSTPNDYGPVGPNRWLVDEMYQLYLDDPARVAEQWREFFADYRPDMRHTGPVPIIRADAPVPKAPTPPTQSPGTPEPVAPTPAAREQSPAVPAGAIALRGAAARIVANMEASLGVPTATSVRNVPARLLEVNRELINNQLARLDGGKVSFTHIIAFALVRALDHVPAMKRVYLESEGQPYVVPATDVGLGLAVDVERSDGSRSLLVPCIKKVNSLSFREFWSAYEDLIHKVRTNKITPDDFAGVTLTLTNPGTIGTVHSVPRLTPGQSVIIGVGSIGYPPEFQAADPAVLAELGVSKVITVTSTYDHRVIQGAESGLYLGRIHELLLGEHGFYDEVFQSLGIPYEPARWARDSNAMGKDEAQRDKQLRVQNLVTMFRERGHLIAELDPLGLEPVETHAEVDPATYGLTLWDLDREFSTDLLGGTKVMKLRDMLRILRDSYCRTIGIEHTHIQDPARKAWVQQQIENVSFSLDIEDKRHLLARLNAAEAFERFLSVKYVGHKRFGLEGAESLIPVLDTILGFSANLGTEQAIIGMAHRGRLNVLANVVGKSYNEIFREFEGDIDPDMIQGTGDVKYHKGAHGKFVSRHGNEIVVALASNPSHLEAVGPVVEGMARAKLDMMAKDGADGEPVLPISRVLPILIHGDAAFAGQGVVAETLNLSNLEGYRTGGTIHIVVNNQVGFTTRPQDARSTKYSTDVAKMVQAPIFHVNGDDPEACVRVARLASAYRDKFNQDVIIDMVCYRRFGHNETDEPSYTLPKMYRQIEARRSVRKLYTETLINRGELTLEEAERALQDFSDRLQGALDQTRLTAPPKDTKALPQPEPQGVLPRVSTGVSGVALGQVMDALQTVPDGFTVHPKLVRQREAQKTLFEGGEVDWALGEAFGFGTLLLEGIDVRVAGQDSRRGTFSHRHAVLTDYENESTYVPLANLPGHSGEFSIFDSSLSEYAALGFEYGYSVEHKDSLTVWEAQFGDFSNGAQIVIDQFLVAAEEKWGQTSGLVLLLPHGYEGQGPEHSSARIERFLTLCADDNVQVINPTSAAQLFHVLRRQLHREVRKPLVVFTPKSLLRAKESRSKVSELLSGSFEEALDDKDLAVPRESVSRVVLCSGKVAFDAIARRTFLQAPVAIVRVEQLYPWPSERLGEILAGYPNARELVWLQEEPGNMGSALWVFPLLHDLLDESWSFSIEARSASGSPAVGSARVHAQEQEELLDRAVGPLPST